MYILQKHDCCETLEWGVMLTGRGRVLGWPGCTGERSREAREGSCWNITFETDAMLETTGDIYTMSVALQREKHHDSHELMT